MPRITLFPTSFFRGKTSHTIQIYIAQFWPYFYRELMNFLRAKMLETSGRESGLIQNFDSIFIYICTSRQRKRDDATCHICIFRSIEKDMNTFSKGFLFNIPDAWHNACTIYIIRQTLPQLLMVLV